MFIVPNKHGRSPEWSTGRVISPAVTESAERSTGRGARLNLALDFHIRSHRAKYYARTRVAVNTQSAHLRKIDA